MSIAIEPFGNDPVGAPFVVSVIRPPEASKIVSVVRCPTASLYRRASPAAEPEDYVILPPASIRILGCASPVVLADTASSEGLANSMPRSGVPTNLVMNPASTVFYLGTPRGAM